MSKTVINLNKDTKKKNNQEALRPACGTLKIYNLLITTCLMEAQGGVYKKVKNQHTPLV